MAIVELYSKRKKRLELDPAPDVYQYETLPQPFRVQVVHIWRDAIGPYVDTSRSYSHTAYPPGPANRYWTRILKTMCREKAVFRLMEGANNPEEECVHYLLTADTEGALDIIEYSFRLIDVVLRNDLQLTQPKQRADSAIEDLNERFREHAVGYEYANSIIIRIDSQILHGEVVRPALQLLNAPGFQGPNEEFIKAFDHYRHGREKEAVQEALKAFESTMKAICAARGWSYPSNAGAKELLNVLLVQGLIPAELRAHFSAFRAAMECGLPTLRNKTSGHGQGPEPKYLPPHFAAYALHLAAADIVFLVQAHNSAGGGP